MWLVYGEKAKSSGRWGWGEVGKDTTREGHGEWGIWILLWLQLEGTGGLQVREMICHFKQGIWFIFWEDLLDCWAENEQWASSLEAQRLVRLWLLQWASRKVIVTWSRTRGMEMVRSGRIPNTYLEAELLKLADILDIWGKARLKMTPWLGAWMLSWMVVLVF